MDNELTRKIKNIQTNIRDLKTRQVIGGDSWIVYRTQLSMPSPASGSGQTIPKYRLDFTPDVEGSFVAKAYNTSTDRTQYGSDQDLIPDPNYFGRWYVTNGLFNGWDIMIYSTKKGTATVTVIP